MKSADIMVVILVAASILMIILARRFDKRYYIPFLHSLNHKSIDPSVCDPGLVKVGLIVAGCGAVIYGLVGLIWALWI